MADFNLNIDDLVTEFGAKYINRGQTEKDIKTELFAQDDFSKYFTKVPETNTEYTSAYVTISEILQAFSVDFTPKGGAVFTPWVQKLGRPKIDVSISPDSVVQSWAGFLANLSEVDRAKWPLIEWMLRNLIIPKAKQDHFLNVAYWGFQYTGTGGAQAVSGSAFTRVVTAGQVAAGLPANASEDGVHTVLAKMHADGRLGLEHAMGTLATDPVDFCEQVEAMALDSGMSEELRNSIDYFFMSMTNYRLYREGRRAKYNLNYNQVDDMDLIHETPIKVLGTRAMTGSNQIWGTPAANRRNPVKADNMGRFDVQKADRKVKFLSDWMQVKTFDVPELIVVNDQDLTISSTMVTNRYTIS